MKVTIDEFEIDITKDNLLYDAFRYLKLSRMAKKEFEEEKQLEEKPDAEIIVFQKKDVLQYYQQLKSYITSAANALNEQNYLMTSHYQGRIFENLRINIKKLEGENGSSN